VAVAEVLLVQLMAAHIIVLIPGEMAELAAPLVHPAAAAIKAMMVAMLKRRQGCLVGVRAEQAVLVLLFRVVV
jgi:hypothetical protein